MNKELLEKELAPFLSPDAKEDVKTIAIENVLGLTGADDGKKFLGESDILLSGIVSLTGDQRSDMKESSYKALINLSSQENISLNIIKLTKYPNQFSDWLKCALDPKFKLADLVCKLLSNLTRSEQCAELAAKQVLESTEVGIEKIVMALCNVVYNNDADLHYLGALLSNLSQIREVRVKIMDKEQCIIQRLLPFTEFRQSEVRRLGIVGTLKNCCFDTEYHDWLLGEQVDLLPRLLLPLAGPEEFDDDDMEKLPDDLQYLPPDKEREPVADIRKMITEALLQLCATKSGKKYVKDKNSYVIMREYYAWERQRHSVNELSAMNLIDILIGDEPEAQFGDNIKEVEIPEDIKQQFHEDDRKELEMAYKEQQERETETQSTETGTQLTETGTQ